jgi:hypothetical protein
VFKFDQQKNERQIAFAGKLVPLIIGVWLIIEVLAGNANWAVGVAISLIGIWLSDFLIKRTSLLRALRSRELQNKFQWKIEAIYFALIGASVWLGWYVGNVI